MSLGCLTCAHAHRALSFSRGVEPLQLEKMRALWAYTQFECPEVATRGCANVASSPSWKQQDKGRARGLAVFAERSPHSWMCSRNRGSTWKRNMYYSWDKELYRGFLENIGRWTCTLNLCSMINLPQRCHFRSMNVNLGLLVVHQIPKPETLGSCLN